MNLRGPRAFPGNWSPGGLGGPELSGSQESEPLASVGHPDTRPPGEAGLRENTEKRDRARGLVQAPAEVRQVQETNVEEGVTGTEV